jgi:hypothetical protein
MSFIQPPSENVRRAIAGVNGNPGWSVTAVIASANNGKVSGGTKAPLFGGAAVKMIRISIKS